jgi:hypothetical protein
MVFISLIKRRLQAVGPAFTEGFAGRLPESARLLLKPSIPILHTAATMT